MEITAPLINSNIDRDGPKLARLDETRTLICIVKWKNVFLERDADSAFGVDASSERRCGSSIKVPRGLARKVGLESGYTQPQCLLKSVPQGAVKIDGHIVEYSVFIKLNTVANLNERSSG